MPNLKSKFKKQNGGFNMAKKYLKSSLDILQPRYLGVFEGADSEAEVKTSTKNVLIVINNLFKYIIIYLFYLFI